MHVDFSTLFFSDPEWESQKEIPFSKKMKLLTCLMYVDFDVPYLIRYLGGQYTGDDRDVSAIIKNLRGIVPQHTVEQIECIHCRIPYIFPRGYVSRQFSGLLEIR